MTWTRLSDTLNGDPRMMRLSDAAFRLHIKALVWSNQVLTDGLVPADVLPSLMHSHPDRDALVAELVKVGLWQKLPDEDSWQMDWDDQEEADEVRERKAYRADIQRRYRRRERLHKQGDHSECLAGKCPSRKAGVTGNVTGNETGNVTSRVTTSRPVPSRPITGTGTGAGGASENGSHAAAPAAARRGPGCEECDRGWIELDDGSVAKCPNCRPGAKTKRENVAPAAPAAKKGKARADRDLAALDPEPVDALDSLERVAAGGSVKERWLARVEATGRLRT